MMFRRATATFVASGLLIACTAISGVGELEATEPDESPVVEGRDASSSSSSSSSSSGGSSSSSASSASSASSSSSSSSSSSASSASSSSSGSPDAGQDSGGTGPTVFSDNFNRTSSATVGNNWKEKTDHFSIQENQLVNVSAADDGYYNISCYSPLAGRDVEVKVDVTFPASDTTYEADPMIVLRASDASVKDYNTLDGYVFYFYRDYAAIGIEDAGDENDDLATKQDFDLATGVPYHVTFSVTGTSPPQLKATVTDANNTTVIALTANDKLAKYKTAGRVAVTVSTEGQNVKWDNFVQTVTQ